MWIRCLLTTLFAFTVGANVAFADAPAVTLKQDTTSFTLTNALVTARVDKQSGDLLSLKYKNIEMLGNASGHPFGYWSHTPTRGGRTVTTVTIDPSNNHGDRAEVSVKGFYQGTALGVGPGGSVAADIEIRYTLGRNDSGIYTYSIFDHKPDYPATSVGEARFALKLNNDVFDYMTVDANRRREMITASDWSHGTQLNMKEVRRINTGKFKGQVEHKYDYSAVQFDTPAMGWSSTKQKIGFWCVNPTIEYLSGGPTKVELNAHRDAVFSTNPNAGASPTILNYWRGSHYGGSRCDIAAGEAWTKIIGPFLLYCNAGPSPNAMWKDALQAANREAKAWPYGWVSGVDYPTKNQRGTVYGRITLNDSSSPSDKMSHLLVGLTQDKSPSGESIDWQTDAKQYQFWVRADNGGRFTIPNVRPGTYSLHAIADGVLGEFTKTEVIVSAGRKVNEGELRWTPIRHGRQLWEIGVPDRTAAEFLHGDHYWQWGLYNQYPTDFPKDVNFVIGQSDFRRDWNYCQCPREDRPQGTPWTITFDLPKATSGVATLRLSFAATSARSLQVALNGASVGTVGPLVDTATIRRDGIRGYWQERDVPFDAALLKQGKNVLTLTIPPGNVMSGIEYDYLRLELQEAKK
jgi:rhamnogalacturonan endolyase